MGCQLPDTRSLISGAALWKCLFFHAKLLVPTTVIIGCGCTVVLRSSTFPRAYKHIHSPFSIREVSQVAFLTPPKASSERECGKWGLCLSESASTCVSLSYPLLTYRPQNHSLAIGNTCKHLRINRDLTNSNPFLTVASSLIAKRTYCAAN